MRELVPDERDAILHGNGAAMDSVFMAASEPKEPGMSRKYL